MLLLNALSKNTQLYSKKHKSQLDAFVIGEFVFGKYHKTLGVVNEMYV